MLAKCFDPNEKNLEEKMIRHLRNNKISCDDANRLVYHFSRMKKDKALKIVLIHHPQPLSINMKQLSEHAIQIITSHDNFVIESLKKAAVDGDFDSAKKIIDEKPYVDVIEIFDSPASDSTFKMIIDYCMSNKKQPEDFYYRMLRRIPHKLLSYVFANFDRWGRPLSYDNYEYLIDTFLSGGRKSIIYEGLHTFFPDVDYHDVINNSINSGNHEMVRVILFTKPHLADYSLQYLKNNIRLYRNIDLYKIIIAFSRPTHLDEPKYYRCQSSMNESRDFFKKFNENPQKAVHDFRVEFGVCSDASKIFAMTIFLCDDFLAIN